MRKDEWNAVQKYLKLLLQPRKVLHKYKRFTISPFTHKLFFFCLFCETFTYPLTLTITNICLILSLTVTPLNLKVHTLDWSMNFSTRQNVLTTIVISLQLCRKCSHKQDRIMSGGLTCHLHCLQEHLQFHVVHFQVLLQLTAAATTASDLFLSHVFINQMCGDQRISPGPTAGTDSPHRVYLY